MTNPDPSDGPLLPLPAQPADVPWPTGAWPEGDLPGGVELDPLVARAFDPDGPLHETYAVVIVHRGRLVLERYGGHLPRWDGPGRPVVRETLLLS